MPRSREEFENQSGQRLAALLEYPEGEPKSYALFAHCFSCGKESAAAARIARALVDQDIAVLRFDFTGLGNSEGDFSNTNFSSNVEDLIAAAGFLRAQYRAPQLLIGHSLGGTAVLAAAPAIEEVKAVATLAAPSTAAHVLRHFEESREQIEREGEAEVDIGGRPFKIKHQFIEDVTDANVGERVAKLGAALLVMHSPVDSVVNIDEATNIFVRARHPKSFVSLDDADHLLSDKAIAEYAARTIAAWCSRYVDASVPGSDRETGLEAGQVRVTEHNRVFARRVEADEQSWLADEPTGVGGHELGPDPYEHLLAALGTCTSMTLRMYARRKELPLDDVRVTLSHDRTHATDCEGCDEKPMRIEKISQTLEFTGDLSDEQRQRLMEIAEKCPVNRTLTGELRIEKQEKRHA